MSSVLWVPINAIYPCVTIIITVAAACMWWWNCYVAVVPEGHSIVMRRGKHQRRYKPGRYLITKSDRVCSVRWTAPFATEPFVSGRLIPDVIVVDSEDSAAVSSEGVQCTLHKSMRLTVVDHVAAVGGGDVTYGLCTLLTDELRSKVRSMSVVDLRVGHGVLQQHMMKYAQNLPAGCGLAVESFVVRQIVMPQDVTRVLEELALFKAVHTSKMEKEAGLMQIRQNDQAAAAETRAHQASLTMIDDAVAHHREMRKMDVEKLRMKYQTELDTAKIAQDGASAVKLVNALTELETAKIAQKGVYASKLLDELRIFNDALMATRKEIAEQWINRGMSPTHADILLGQNNSCIMQGGPEQTLLPEMSL